MKRHFTPEESQSLIDTKLNRLSMCVGKNPYDTKEEAEDKKHKCFAFRGVELRAYQCDFCQKWHLTKKINA